MNRKRGLALAVGLTAAALLLLAVTMTSAFAAGGTTGMPNLVVDQKILQNHWIVRDETFTADSCAAIEGGIQPGDHPVLRFTVSTPNVGDADLVLGDPNQHVAAGDGLYEYAQCHHHFHFRHYALYQLIDPLSGHVWRAAKRGFCMIDFAPAPQLSPVPPKKWTFRTCGSVGVPGNQGISAGWADQYTWSLQGQLFVLDGADGQAPIPPGTYIIRITVDPPFVAAPGERCPYLDPAGFCHMLPESNYFDNVAEATVVIPDHPGRTGVGPAVGENVPNNGGIDGP